MRPYIMPFWNPDRGSSLCGAARRSAHRRHAQRHRGRVTESVLALAVPGQGSRFRYSSLNIFCCPNFVVLVYLRAFLLLSTLIR